MQALFYLWKITFCKIEKSLTVENTICCDKNFANTIYCILMIRILEKMAEDTNRSHRIYCLDLLLFY
jgi:hypothetical protein